MSISGILAASNQGMRAVRNPVNIKIEAAQHSKKIVDPGDKVSYVPRVLNSGTPCYLRVKVSYIRDDIDFKNFVTNFPNTFIQKGDYYYYEPVLNQNESITLFDTVKIPDNAEELTDNKKLVLTIYAEAVQEEGFEPDYSLADPWKGLVPQKNTGIIYYINDGTQKETSKKNPKTGDVIDIYVITFVLSAIGLIVIMITYSNETKNQSF